jgi:hypothetical protein
MKKDNIDGKTNSFTETEDDTHSLRQYASHITTAVERVKENWSLSPT